MKKLMLLTIILTSANAFWQKNFIDKPYIEVSGNADTLVIPNRIYIDVLISEKDTKGKKSVEDLEKDMIAKLKQIGIDTDKNLSMQDMLSNYKKFFLKATDIQKSKSYSILVFDAKMATKVFIGLEEVGISNVNIGKTEHLQAKNIQLLMNGKAMENAKLNALSLTKPLNQKIGNAIHISIMPSIANQLNSRVSGIAIRGAASLYGNRAVDYDTSIEFEKITISSGVNVSFSLE